MKITDFVLGFFILLCMIIAVVTLIGKISQIVGKPVKWVRSRSQDHEKVIKMEQDIKELQAQQDEDRKNSIQHDKKIQARQDDIYNMLIDMQIKNYRWEIVDFSSRLSNGGRANKQSYDHILDSYTEYQALLKKLGRENGKTQASMDVIRKKYEEHLENGF